MKVKVQVQRHYQYNLVPGALPECESMLLFQEEYSGICEKRCLLLKTLHFSAVCFLCISARVSVSAGGEGVGRVAWPWNAVRLESLEKAWFCLGLFRDHRI